MSNLKGKTILITGASSGIGAALTREFASSTDGDVQLILCARRVDKLDELSAELQTKYKSIKILTVKLDVSQVEGIERCVKVISKDYPKIDILVNNAGKALGSSKVGSIDVGDFQTVFNTNVIGMITLTQLILKQMLKSNSGDIVQIGSIAGRETYPGGSIYCSSKAALKSFTDALRKELTSTSIRVIEIAPGNTETEFSLVRSKGDEEQAKQAYKGIQALQAKDIAEAVVFATSRQSNTVISELVIMPTSQAGPNHLHRVEM